MITEKIKLLVLVCTGGKYIKDRLKEAVIDTLCQNETPEIETYESDCLGILDEETGELSYDFLRIREGKFKVVITDSDMIVRQINCAIMKGSIKNEKVHPKIPALGYDELLAYEITRDGEAIELEINPSSGFEVPGMKRVIDEINETMEDLQIKIKRDRN